MSSELKVKINNLTAVQNRLIELGAQFLHKLKITDTYFNTPPDKVIKITEDERGAHFVKLQAKDGKFEVIEFKKINFTVMLKDHYTKKYGVKCILNKTLLAFNWNGFEVSLNLISDVGNYLVLEGENPTVEDIKKIIQEDELEFLNVPFSELVKS